MRTSTLFRMTAMTTALLASTAHAQTNGTFLLTSSNTVSPGSPTATIEIWAAWDDPNGRFIFAGANYDITAGDGIFSNPTIILQGPGTSAGVANGNTITGGVIGQLTLCGIAGCLGSEDNPILMATYDWTTMNFTPREVDLITSNTNNFIVVNLSSRRTVQLFPNEFTPGSGVINVVPAPASWLVAGLIFAAGARRRRT